MAEQERRQQPAAGQPEDPAGEAAPAEYAPEEPDDTLRPVDDADGGEPASAPDAAEDPRSREELLEALRRAETERDEYLQHVQRLQAEFENFRKRTMREGEKQREAGVADTLEKLLDVLDDFDMAVWSVDKTTDFDSLHKGLELVYSKLVTTLKSLGLERIDEDEVTFDPEQHEAVQSVEADEGPLDEPVVVDVLRPGYRLDSRVLRAAMVKVAK